MSGLECKEKLLSEVLKNNLTNRIDSEYFLKSYDKLIDLTKDAKTFSELKIKASGGKRLPQNHSFVDEGTIYVRAEDIKNNIVDWEKSPKVQEKTFNVLKRYQMFNNDVIVTNVGSVGDVAIVKNKDIPILMTENCVRLDTKHSKVTYGYLFTFMMSTYGQTQIEREKVGTVQSKLSLERIRDFRIPTICDELQIKFNEIADQFSKLYWTSKENFREAEEILKKELEIDKYVIRNDKVVINNLSDSFLKTGRLDSEYYQKKYIDYKTIITKYPNGYSTVGDMCLIKDENYFPNDNEKYKYIELSDVSDVGKVDSYSELLGIELPTRARRMVSNGDLIISSIEGSLNSVALITEEYDKALCSNGFNVIISDKINSETLLVLFKSVPIYNLMKKECSGTILTSISKEGFKKIPLPLIYDRVQEQISSKVQQSIENYQRANFLLKKGIKAVEIAIEEGEQMAFEYLRHNFSGK